MKRTTETDAEWDLKLEERKKLAERRMNISDAPNGFFTLKQVHTAAHYWYGADNMNNCCLAETRLQNGETYGE